jgi:hypothetical protein
MIGNALAAVLTEVLDGAGDQSGWILNPKDLGLLASLDKLSASAASTVPPHGGASIAAHVDHLRYGLQLMNRWSRGEQPFGNADWSASWRRVAVTDDEWRQLRADFAAEARAWREAIKRHRDVTIAELTDLIASVSHLAYHFGAIRQIDRSIRGPSSVKPAVSG